jgi:predicted membrane channel-forming protein YqfA (hemolysin III family)
MAQNFSRGTRRILSIYRRALRTGIVTGISLSVLLSAWLLFANRAPNYEQFAAIRNVVAGILGIAIFVWPIVRFARSPRAILLSGEIAWLLLGICYFAWTLYFDDLSDRWSTFHVFMMGGVTYAFIAALAWVTKAMISARGHNGGHADHPLENHNTHTLSHS